MYSFQKLIFIILLIFTILSSCSGKKIVEVTEKTIYYPDSAWNISPNNDYKNDTSQFSLNRMIKTENLVTFWEKGFGNDPATCNDEKFRFPIHDVIQETEKMFVFYRDSLKFVEKGKSLTDKYPMMLYIYYNEDGTVYGGGSDEKVGIMWISPNRVKSSPYGAMAHELGHAFQYMVSCDGNWGFSTTPEGSFGQTIFEMTSQYMLWQYYPEWITFEKYHLDGFMAKTHKAFLHEDNCYHSPFVLEYWSQKHGIDFIGQLWRDSQKGEDAVMTYKRKTGLSQSEFNDEIFDAYRRFITWDMDRIREVSKDYANQHTSKMLETKNGWFKIAQERCPENYGYNGIQLNVPDVGTEINLDFKGIVGDSDYRSINIDKAGWRYGFVAYKENGERVYSPIYSDTEGQAKFVVPEYTQYLWLVVSGAPTEHWEHLWDGKPENDEQWPYQIKLNGTSLHDSVLK